MKRALFPIVTLLVFSFCVFWILDRNHFVPPGNAADVRISYSCNSRTFEPRLVGLPFAPYIGKPVFAEKKVKPKRGSTLAGRGIASLFAGDINGAAAILEKAAEQDPTNLAVASDLAAVYTIRGERKRQPLDLSNSLSLIDRLIVLPAATE